MQFLFFVVTLINNFKNRYMKLKAAFFVITAILSCKSVCASDVLKINLQQADSLFQANNYYLLASSMNVEAQKAMVIQAKLLETTQVVLHIQNILSHST